MFCFGSESEEETRRSHRRQRNRRPEDKQQNKSGWFSSQIGSRQNVHPVRSNGEDEDDERPPTRRSSMRSGIDRQHPAISVENELRDVKNELCKWLTFHNIPFDASQATATPLLHNIFAAYASLCEDNRKQEERLGRRETRLRDCENHLASTEQEISRLEQYYQNLLTQERLQSERLVAGHHAEVAALDARLIDRQKQHQTFVDDLVSDHQARLSQYHQDRQIEVSALKQSHQTDINNLQHQHQASLHQERQKVKQVEEDMRMSVDHFQALQDDELKHRFYKLGIEIESLSRLSPVSDFIERARANGANVHIPSNLLSRHHKLLFQGVLWSMIVNSIFHKPFTAFGTYGASLYDTWTALFNHEQNQTSDWPQAHPLAEKWRYTTVERLELALKMPTSNPQDPNQHIQKSYHTSINTQTSQLISLFSADPSQAQTLPIRLHTLVTQASHFAILIARERCRVRIFLPAQSSLGPHMSRASNDIQGVHPGDEEDVPFATAEFVVAPGLVKEGTSRGGKLEERIVLTKALVYFDLDDQGTKP